MIKLDPSALSSEEITNILKLFYRIRTEQVRQDEVPRHATSENEDTTNDAGIDFDSYGFPSKMLSFLSNKNHLYHKIEGALDAPNWIELRSSNELRVIDLTFFVDDENIRITHDNYLTDPNRHSEDVVEYGNYSGKGIDIIKASDLYFGEGLLIWIVELQLFASYDPEHENLVVFPDATAADVIGNFGLYLQAQWSYGKDYVIKCGNIYDYFKPWEYFTYQ